MSARTLFALLVCLGCADVGARSLEGDGELRRFDAPGDRGVLRAVAGGEGRYLFFVMTGPRPLLYCTDLDLEPVSSKEGVWGSLAPGDPAHLCAYETFYGFRLLSIPDLRLEDAELIGPDSGVGDGFGTDILRLKDGWVYVGRRGHVARLREAGFRLTKVGRSSLAYVEGTTLDPKQGRLLLCGDDRHLEEFDLDRMAPVGRWELDLHAVAGIRARGGTAFVATDEGLLARVDLATHEVVERIRLMEGEDPVRVDLDLSPSGEMLVASATRSLGNHTFAAVLKLYRVEGGTLTPVASATATLHRMIYDLLIVDSREMVILVSQCPLVWSYGEGR